MAELSRATQSPGKDNPYIGPRPFEEKDSQNFFGRSKEIRQLASLVIAQRAVLLYAQSGAGKTSLIQAGFIPDLNGRKKIVILPTTRVSGDLPPGLARTEVKNIYSFNTLLNLLRQEARPHDLMGLSLSEGLRSYFVAQNPAEVTRPRPRLLIIDQFEELFTTHPDRYPERANFFLQLQEALFTYPRLSLLLVMREDYIAHLDSYAAQLPDRLRARYRMERLQYEIALEAIKEPAQRAGRPYAPNVAESLADNLRRIQLGALPALPGSEPALAEVIVRLDRNFDNFMPLDQEKFRAALAYWLDLSPDQIHLVAVQAGSVLLTLQLPPAAAQSLKRLVDEQDPRLQPLAITEVTLANLAAQPSLLGNYVEPVHLQIVCRQLWASLPPGQKQILAEDVRAFGDVDQALIDFYEDAMDRVVQQTKLSKRLLRLWFDTHLITPGRTRGVVHRGIEETAGLPNTAIDILNNAYIIRADIRGNDIWYELTHDRLVEPVLNANSRWQATYYNPLAAAHKGWLAAGRAPNKLLKGTQLEEAEAYARDYPADITGEEKHFLAESRYQADQAVRRRRALIMAGLLVMVVLSLCTVAALWSAGRAQESLRDAQTAQARAAEQQAAAVAAGGTAVAERDKAATAEAISLTQRDSAATARTNAESQKLLAQAAGVTAIAERDNAATAQGQALTERDRAAMAGAIANQQKATAQIERDNAATAEALAEQQKAAAQAERDNAATAEANAEQQKVAAEAAGATALAERDIAATAQVLTEEQRAAAEAARAEAERQRQEAADAQQAAEEAQEEAEEAQEEAEEAQEEAETQADEAQRQANLAFSYKLVGHATVLIDSRPDLALLLTVEANSIQNLNTFEARSFLLTSLQQLDPRFKASLSGHTNYVNSVAFSPDGKTLASGSYDNTIILWDTATRQPLGQPLSGHTGPVLSAVFSPDGKTLASGSYDNTIILWDVSDPIAPQLLGQLYGHIDLVTNLAFSPNGKTLASGSYDNTIILWDVSDPTNPQRLGPSLNSHTAQVSSVAFSPDGKTLASGSYDNTIILWNTATGQSLGQPLSGHTDFVYGVAFSPDGETLASGSGDDTLILWDTATRQPLGQPLSGHTDTVLGVAFSPDGKTLASGSGDTTLILWDTATRQPLGQPLSGHTSAVTSVAFSPDGKTLASGSYDTTIILWDPATRQPLGQPLSGHTNTVFGVAFSLDDKTLASGSGDGTIILWVTATRQRLAPPLSGHTNYVYSVAFSPDGKTLASGSCGQLNDEGCIQGQIILWDVSDPTGPQPLSGHTHTVSSVAFSPDGRTLASGSYDNTIILWDIATRQPLAPPLSGHTNYVYSVTFSPDGKTLASGGYDGAINLWDTATHQPHGQPLSGHPGGVSSVAFSPDGKTLASGSCGQLNDEGCIQGQIILWDVSDPTGPQPLGQPLSGHTGAVTSVAFSPDGKTLASGSYDTTIILWDVSLNSWKNRACQIANRNMTEAEWRQYMGERPYQETCPPR